MKCKECGEELKLSGFENNEEAERVDLYACQNEDCPKKLAQVRVEGDA